MTYSFLRLAREGLSGNAGWTLAWRDPAPKAEYDVLIIGGGGHGLVTAYYLAKEHGVTNVAELEKGWIGSGNARRNTTIIRSNYLLPGNEGFYEHSMQLWEGLERDLNHNTMVSQRGVLNLFATDAARDAGARRGNAMRLHGVDAARRQADRATAHYVTPHLDEGPIIEQDVERISHTSTPEDLVRMVRIGRDVERRLLAWAVAWHLDSRVLLNGAQAVVFCD